MAFYTSWAARDSGICQSPVNASADVASGLDIMQIIKKKGVII